MTARPRMAHRKPPALSPQDAARALDELTDAMGAVDKARSLLVHSPAAEVLDEVSRLLELARTHAAVEAEIAEEITRRTA